MGYTRWSDKTWSAYSADTSTKPADKIFTKRELDVDLDPTKFEVRESRDSVLNPNSTPIIIGTDVTGSMGSLADYFIKTGLGVLFEAIIDRKPVPDPHIMVMAIGDSHYDDSPIQVSQFESDITIANWLEKVHVEKGGGGNNFESYDLPYYVAAYKTSTDSFEKRGKKGYLFTIGDEPPPSVTPKSHITKFIGDTPQADVQFVDSIVAASKMYHCYHIIVTQGSGCSGDRVNSVKAKWQALLGQNAILLTEVKDLAEVIVSIIQVNEGVDAEDVATSWSGTTELAVRAAISGLTATTASRGEVTLF
jgi:hypothetical protein